MNYSERIIKKRRGRKKSSIEVLINMELSEGDALELLRINERHPSNLWLREVANMVKQSLSKSTAIQEYDIDLNNLL